MLANKKLSISPGNQGEEQYCIGRWLNMERITGEEHDGRCRVPTNGGNNFLVNILGN